jgi:hypothetical protein
MATNNVLDAVLAQYEQSTQSSTNSTSKMSSEDRMKKYFAAILKDNEKQGQKRVRILPTTDGSSPFKEVWFHEIQVNGVYNKFYDPDKNEGGRSPLTEVYEELMKTGKESDKELAKQYKARKFYIVKVIDRDHEDEGVKFWRFKHNYKQDGVLDKIIPIWRSKGNITDVNEGRDLIIQLVKSKTPKGKEYTTIQTIMHDDPSALSADKAQLEEWKNDTTTWEDVYSKKPVEYLEAIARGEVPRWDSEAKKYVYGDEASESFGGKANYSDPQAGMDADEELPF